jgi:hypothetical protein
MTTLHVWMVFGFEMRLIMNYSKPFGCSLKVTLAFFFTFLPEQEAFVVKNFSAVFPFHRYYPKNKKNGYAES